ncbi:MAG TPA: hypothetical protein VE344_08545 [Methylomirabilota bacterium]|nr:hypothetical protein [Methylomirabilota bacterium]
MNAIDYAFGFIQLVLIFGGWPLLVFLSRNSRQFRQVLRYSVAGFVLMMLVFVIPPIPMSSRAVLTTSQRIYEIAFIILAALPYVVLVFLLVLRVLRRLL